jgi:Uma2 family endonuclease
MVNGRYRQLPPMSPRAAVFASRLATRLATYVAFHGSGEVLLQLLCGLKTTPRQELRPDVAFVSYDRWPRDRPWPDTDPTPVVPELAVEVVSPNDVAEDLLHKVKAYLEAGTQLVWVVYPPAGWVVVFEPGGRSRYLTAADELDGGTVLPEFRLRLRELFTQSSTDGAAAPETPDEPTDP